MTDTGRQTTLESMSAYEQLIARVNRATERSSDGVTPEIEELLMEMEQLYETHIQSGDNPAPIVADTDRQAFTRMLTLLRKRMQKQVNTSSTALTAKIFAERVRDQWAVSDDRTDAETRRRFGQLLFQSGSFFPPVPTIRGAFAVSRPAGRSGRKAITREEGDVDTAEGLSTTDLGVSEDIIKTYALIKKTVEDDYYSNDGKAVNLYVLVLNPDSYSQTVENLFHVSHLVNDRSLAILTSSSGLPLVAPASAARGSGSLTLANTSAANITPEETPDVSLTSEAGSRQQFVVHMTYELFDKLCVALKEDLTDEDGVVRPYLPSRRERDAFDRSAQPLQ